MTTTNTTPNTPASANPAISFEIVHSPYPTLHILVALTTSNLVWRFTTLNNLPQSLQDNVLRAINDYMLLSGRTVRHVSSYYDYATGCYLKAHLAVSV